MDGMSPMKFNLEVGLAKWNFKEVIKPRAKNAKSEQKKITYT